MWRRNLLLHWKSYSKIVHRNTHSNWDRQNYLPTNLQLLIHILLWKSENGRVCTCIPPPSSFMPNCLWISMCFFLHSAVFFLFRQMNFETQIKCYSHFITKINQFVHISQIRTKTFPPLRWAITVFFDAMNWWREREKKRK